MVIKIGNLTCNDLKLKFDSLEDLEKFNSQILSSLMDSTNTRGVVYDQDDKYIIIPALALKNSIIQIDKSDNSKAPLFF